MTKIKTILSLITTKVSLFLAFIMLALLVFLTTGAVEHVNLLTYEDMPVLYQWNALYKIIGIILLSLIGPGILIFFQKIKKETLITVISFLFSSAFGLWWIIVDEFPIAGDARAVSDMARAIAYSTDMSDFVDYFDTYANQRGIVLLEALFYKAFHDKAYIVLRLLNLAMILATIYTFSLIAYDIWNDEKIMLMTRILLSMFLPFTLFTNLVYGTIPSIFLLVLGFKLALNLCKNGHIINTVLTTLCFTLAMFIYQGAMIAVLATIIYILFIGTQKPSFNIVLTAVLLVLSMVFTGKIANGLFNTITGLDLGKGMPAIAWIYMGLSAGDGANGAGSYNNIHAIAYENNNYDSAQTSSYCAKEIINVLSEYLTGKRPLFFFYEKTRCQWTNSLFDSTQITQFPSYEKFVLTDKYRNLLMGKEMLALILFSDLFQMLIYLLAFLWLLRSIITKKYSSGAFLLIIFFIGGFLFQLMWEQKARYCMPYFMALIPLAACELTRFAHSKDDKNADRN